MLYAVGAVAFALILVASVCLHEAGHMLTAKAFGMSVTRYFVGFGRTVFSFRRGETEYGLKAIPAGGFVTIVGMNPDDLEDGGAAAAQGRAFWQFPVWKRSIVLAAGSVTHVLLALVLLFVALVGFGLPKVKGTDQSSATLGSVQSCVYDTDAGGTGRACRPGDPRSPAAAAGLQAGDRVVRLGDREVPTYDAFSRALRTSPVGTPIPVTYVRDGQTRTTTVTLVSTLKPGLGAAKGSPTHPTPTIGVTAFLESYTQHFGVVDGAGQTVSLTGQMLAASVTSLGALPSRIPALFRSLSGGERSVDDPVSVVGATRIGGELAADQGIGGIGSFLAILASLNVFLGLFNLLPLPPLDGGHLAITWFEKARSLIASRRGRPEPGMVDRNRLVPVTLAVLVVFGAFTLLTVSADIVNPIRLG